MDQKILNPDAADLALLPRTIAGAAELAKRPGWRPVYMDNLAVILARDFERFPALRSVALPVVGLPPSTEGRAKFPDQVPL